MTREESESLPGYDEDYKLEPDMVDRNGKRYADYEEYEAETARQGRAINEDFGTLQPFAPLPALDREGRTADTARPVIGGKRHVRR